MPRKSKEEKDELNIKENKAKSDKKSTKKVSNKTSTSSKKSTTKTAVSKSKTTAKKSTTKKTTTTKKTSSKKKVVPVVNEYYDLPFRYNQTVVRILAQTPNKLFIYWDISDEDRNNYEKKYGSDFFYNTRPYLIVTNTTMNYTFEVEINDFANSWYLNINDASCDYKVELARKFIVDSKHNASISNTAEEHLTPYFANETLTITISNELEVPNDHILIEKLGSSVFFRNVKTNIVEEKSTSSLSFMQKIGNIYNIYDLYKQMYHDELKENELSVNLSSSSSSSFK